jgi:hypothetical protein
MAVRHDCQRPFDARAGRRLLAARRETTSPQRTSGDYIAGAPGKPAATKLSASVVSVDVTGNPASAKIELDYPNARLTDYMSLVKIGGEWKIVNKIFTSEAMVR